jgi:hypothetical protein
MEHIRLPVLDNYGTQVVTYELVEVERESNGAFRMAHSPAFVAGIARGDVFEIHAGTLAGYRIVRRGGMLAAVIAFVSEEQKGTATHQLDRTLRALGGICEGGPPRLLVFSIPVAAGFAAAEGFLEAACVRFPGAQWFFGNVWGHDGQPLNWWVKSPE